MKATATTAALLLMTLAGCGATSSPTALSDPQPASAAEPTPSKEKSAVQPPLHVAADIAQRLAKFSPTPIDFDQSLIGPSERKVLLKLIAAAQILDDIFLDQVSGDNRALRQRLQEQGAPAEALTYFDVMYGPWDRLQGDEPFVGTAPKPEGAGYYPPDLSKEELEAWIEDHPETEDAFRNYFTVIRRAANGGLVAVPYAQAYAERLARAAALLKEAAALSTHPALKRYLELRAEAFLSNDYFESDMAWMDLGDSPLEVVLGPYEVYEDKLMGYKAAFEAFITLRDPHYSKELQKLAKYNLELERNLPLPRKYFTKRGLESPISVVIELYTAGDTRAGVQTAAFNLPNDERVRTQKGSKKVMLKNVTEAKFHQILLPIAKEVLDPALLAQVNFDAYFTDILLHEVAHGMGPGQITVKGKKTEVNRELKDLYPAIEECKADIVGLVNGAMLVRKGALPKAMARELPATYLAGIFRAVRFGVEAAHAKAVLLSFNYLVKHGAFTYDAASGRYGVNHARFDKVARQLAGELLLLQAQGDYSKAKQLLQTYGELSPQMKQALSRLRTIPVDIRPEYTILTKMRGW